MNSETNEKLLKQIGDQSLCLLREGDMFCVHAQNFKNLQESVAGFGQCPTTALGDYFTCLEIDELRKEGLASMHECKKCGERLVNGKCEACDKLSPCCGVEYDKSILICPKCNSHI
jgi:hypothetical protein